MNDDILQHHFDEVFNALQDKENFEIFTGLKKVQSPRIKKTLVKILRPSSSPPPTPPTYCSPTTTTNTESMSSAFSLVSKSERLKRECKMFVEGSRNNQNSAQNSVPSIAGKLYFMPPREERKKIACRNTLFECKYCGRYILGDFLQIHEEKCSGESVSYGVQ